MLHTRTAIEYRAGTGRERGMIVESPRCAAESSERRSDLPTSRRWMKFWQIRFRRVTHHHGLLGSCVRTRRVVWNLREAERSRGHRTIVASRGSCALGPTSGSRTFLQGLVSLAGAAGIALLVPVRDSPGRTARGACRSRRARGDRLALRRRPALASQRCNGVANSCSPEP